jgi:hypothetical protein
LRKKSRPIISDEERMILLKRIVKEQAEVYSRVS